jgi:hypothetical protein
MDAQTMIAGLALAVLAATSGEKSRALAAGTWGGDHVVLHVSDKGGELDFDCANGRITEPIAPDGDGQFDVKGTYATEHGGPVRDDDPGAAPVRYKGKVGGDTMTLSIVRKDDTVGPFTLTRGREVNLTKCR